MPANLSENFCLTGDEVSFEQAESLKTTGDRMISGQTTAIRMDLGELDRANTLTVSLLTHWFRTAQQQNKSIVFVNLSQELRNIIDFSGLNQVLLAD
ncbi:MAG: ABC-type transporter Mla MlaB component [Limisphaerales bacterium]